MVFSTNLFDHDIVAGLFLGHGCTGDEGQMSGAAGGGGAVGDRGAQVEERGANDDDEDDGDNGGSAHGLLGLTVRHHAEHSSAGDMRGARSGGGSRGHANTVTIDPSKEAVSGVHYKAVVPADKDQRRINNNNGGSNSSSSSSIVNALHIP